MSCSFRFVDKVGNVESMTTTMRLYRKEGMLKVSVSSVESYSGKTLEKFFEPSWETLCELLSALEEGTEKIIYQGNYKVGIKKVCDKTFFNIADGLGSIGIKLTTSVKQGLKLILADAISRGWRTGEAK